MPPFQAASLIFRASFITFRCRHFASRHAADDSARCQRLLSPGSDSAAAAGCRHCLHLAAITPSHAAFASGFDPVSRHFHFAATFSFAAARAAVEA